MILVSDAGSMRVSASCEASTWPLVASSSSQDLAAMVGAGNGLREGGGHQKSSGGECRN